MKFKPNAPIYPSDVQDLRHPRPQATVKGFGYQLAPGRGKGLYGKTAWPHWERTAPWRQGELHTYMPIDPAKARKSVGGHMLNKRLSGR